MKTFASVYIGSHEIIMKVFEINAKKSLREIDCLKTQTDLVGDIYKQGSVSFQTVDKICNVLTDMKKTMDMYQVDAYKAYAGDTLRRADNQLFVLEQIRIRTKMQVYVLSNSEHRFLGYRAIASMTSFEDMLEDSAAIVDIGGTSIQITLFCKGKIVTTQHLTFGTATMRESMKKLESLGDHEEQITEMINKELDVFCKMFLQNMSLQYLILLGDNMSSLIRKMKLKKEGALIPTDLYLEQLNRFGANNVAQMIEELDLSEDNEEFILAYLLLHRAVANKMCAKYMMLPGIAVNEGMAYQYAHENKLLKETHDFKQDIVSAAWSIANRYGSYQPHLKALEKISLQIYDVMKKYHGMGQRERILMSVVAILHDCGKYISIAEASNCSYTIIMSSEILGLSHKEREMVAMVVAMNRKPLLSYEELADRFSEDEYMTMVKLLAILKVANAMDRSHKQKFKNVKMAVRNRQLVITMEVEDSISLEKGLFDEKSNFFERVFSIRPVMKEKKII